jgi:uncharacterized protein YraI
MTALRSTIVAGFATVVFLLAPSLAQAAQGFILDQTDLRAGPDEQFPSVDLLPAGAQVEVFGCLGGHAWCDIGFQQDRGWVSGQDLEVIFHSQRVKIVEVTDVQVVPVATFEVAVYWDRYYRNKPFYKDRDHFASLNINIENGGKAAPGKTGSGGQAAVTGTVNGKTEASKTETGGAGMTGKGEASSNPKCPPDQKNCKTQGDAGGMTGGKAATGAGNTREKTAAGSATTGEKTGGVAPKKPSQGMANEKGCKPGMANCPKGAAKGGEAAPAQ